MKTKHIMRKRKNVSTLLFIIVMFYAGCTTTPSQEARPSHAAKQATRHFYEGLQFNNEHKFEQAINSLTKAIRIYPSFQEAFVARGIIYYVLGMHPEAMRDFEEGIRLGLRSQDIKTYTTTTAHTMKGRIYIAFAEYENAIESFNNALGIFPFLADAFNGRSTAHFRLGKMAEALADISVAINIDPLQYFHFCNRGAIFYDLGLYDRALADLIRSLELNPYNARTAVDAAVVAKHLGRYEISLQLYDHALLAEPGFLLAYSGRGNLFIILAGLADDINMRNEFLEKAKADFERGY